MTWRPPQIFFLWTELASNLVAWNSLNALFLPVARCFLLQTTHLTMISTELGEDGQRLFLLLAVHPQQLHGGEALDDKEAPVLELLSH